MDESEAFLVPVLILSQNLKLEYWSMHIFQDRFQETLV